MNNINEKVKEEVNFCIDIFADYLSLNPEKRPRIELFDKMGSSHVPQLNLIRINVNDIGKGHIYFEEVGHFLRDAIFPVTKFTIDRLCDEFLGRLSEDIGKELLKNTKYEYLYEQYEPRDWSNLDEFMKAVPTFAAATIANLKRDQIEDEFILNTIKYAQNTMIPYVGDLERTFKKYDEDHDKIMMTKEVGDAFKIFLSNCKKNKVIIKKGVMSGFLDLHKTFINTIQQINKNVSYLLEAKNVYKNSQNDNEKTEAKHYVTEFYELIKNNYNILEETALKIFNIAESNKRINIMKSAPAKFIISNIYSHFLGYVAAELYIKENPDFMKKVPKLFRKPKEYIKEELILEAEYTKNHRDILTEFLNQYYHKNRKLIRS